MSFDQRLWSSTESTERPMILALRLSNCGFSFAMVPSSVVQTGVKSLGCENRTAQELPIQSWNLILPSVVWASKSGAVSLIARVITLAPSRARKSIRGLVAVYISDCSPRFQLQGGQAYWLLRQ